MLNLKDSIHRDAYLLVISQGLKDTDSFIAMCNYTIDNKYELFMGKYLYDEEMEKMVLPALRRIYGKIYESPPGILLSTHNSKKLIYFKNLFDIDDFINYLSVMLDKTANLLHRFEYLDKAAEHLTLVVDNYIAMMLEKTIDKGDSKMELRDVKIDKLIKDNE